MKFSETTDYDLIISSRLEIIRQRRNYHLNNADIEYNIATDNKNFELIKKISEKRKFLRDLPKIFLDSKFDSLDEIDKWIDKHLS